jgi:hypothetical protein
LGDGDGVDASRVSQRCGGMVVADLTVGPVTLWVAGADELLWWTLGW